MDALRANNFKCSQMYSVKNELPTCILTMVGEIKTLSNCHGIGIIYR